MKKGAPMGSITQGLISQHLGLLSNIIIYMICHIIIITYVCTYLTKRYGLSYMPQANVIYQVLWEHHRFVQFTDGEPKLFHLQTIRLFTWVFIPTL